MRSTRMSRVRAAAVAAVATGLLAGGTAAGASGAFTTAAEPAKGTTDTVVNAGAEVGKQKTFRGTFQAWDGCPYLVTSGGAHYYLEGYTIGGNGALYKKRGGFIAYPGWRIQANGTKKYRSSGHTTLCTTWGDSPYLKAKSIYGIR